MKKDVRSIVFNAVLVIFLALVGCGLLTTPQWDLAHLGVCIVAAGLAAVIGNLDRLESFKAGAGGIEAKTRAIVERAEQRLSELQVMAAQVGSILFDMIDGGGRYGGGSPREKDAQKEALRDLLERVGLTPAQIKAAAAPSLKWAAKDYVNGITSFMPRSSSDNPDWANTWTHMRGKPIDPDTLDGILQRFGGTDLWRLELLADYRHFLKTAEHRRPQIWADRGSWQEWTMKGTWPSGS